MLTTAKTDLPAYFTTREAARHLGAADWQIRKVADLLEPAVPRAGRYRLIPTVLLEQVRGRMIEAGYLQEAEVTTAG